MSAPRVVAFGLAFALVLAACSQGEPTAEPISATPPAATSPSATPSPEAEGIEKLDHLIFIVMENRSFDHYFGTYPGADGFPKNVCVPDPAFGGRCQKQYHDTDTMDVGGPHTKPASDTAINGGRMDGFIQAVYDQPGNVCAKNRSVPSCKERLGPQQQPEVMGYHTRSEIPLYWQIADWGVLQDRMFAPTDSWTLPAHLFLVSAWSAYCPKKDDPMKCTSSLGTPDKLEVPKGKGDTPYAWTDITYLLTEADVSWNYFISPHGTCYEKACDKAKNENKTTGFQNPLPGFTTVKENKDEEHIRPYTEFVKQAKAGELPSVSWIMPAINESEHPGHSDLVDGQRFVEEMVTAVTDGPSWEDSAIFIVWDDWGGFYDHVKPPRIDVNGYGIRVPALMLSPYAKEGLIDSQMLTFDAYLKLIEDRFLDSSRLDPKTMSRPDARPTVREEVKGLGDLAKEFNFNQEPRDPPDLRYP